MKISKFCFMLENVKFFRNVGIMFPVYSVAVHCARVVAPLILSSLILMVSHTQVEHMENVILSIIS